MEVAPLIPYFELPEWVLISQDGLGPGLPPFPVSLKPFGALVAVGVYVGGYLAVWQGKRRGLNERALTSFITWVVGIGFVAGHVLDVLFYYPQQIAQDPWLLIRLWDGLSSFGGFTGAIFGAWLWGISHRSRVLPYADVVASALPVGWVFGRAGCAIAHDHPGILSQAWFAVQYPDGGRFDLGLYEMLLTVPIAVGFLLLAQKPRPWGFFCALLCCIYAPIRFLLDFLRESAPIAPVNPASAVDPRYAALTPAQWGCFGLLAIGLGLMWRLARDAELRQPS